MHADRGELLEDRHGRLNKECAFLLGPASKGRIADALRDRNAQVLMKRHQPVARSRFLEVRALNGNKLCRDQPGKKGMLAKALGERSAPRLRQQAACSCGACHARGYAPGDDVALLGAKHLRDDSESVHREQMFVC